MKGDVYYLKDTTDHNRIAAKFVVDNDDCYLTGKCYDAVSWYSDGSPCDFHYVADVYCKFDACTHWNFYGEDYDPESGGEKDSYYHICGALGFNDHIRCMCFVWKLAHQLVDLDCYYFEDEITEQLVDMMLKGFIIQKG